MIKTYTSDFIVFPNDTNHMSPLIFGGAFIAKMDMCAAMCIRWALYSTLDAHGAVTHQVTQITFHKPCYLGDHIQLEAEITSYNKKSVVVQVRAYRITRAPGPSFTREFVAFAEFVFITIGKVENLQDKPIYLPYVNHNMDVVDK